MRVVPRLRSISTRLFGSFFLWVAFGQFILVSGCSPEWDSRCTQEQPTAFPEHEIPQRTEARGIAIAHMIPPKTRDAALRLRAVAHALYMEVSDREVFADLGKEVERSQPHFVMLENRSHGSTVSSLLEDRGKDRAQFSWVRYRVQSEGHAERIELEGKATLTTWRDTYDQKPLFREVLTFSAPRVYHSADLVAVRALEPSLGEIEARSFVLILWGVDESLVVDLFGHFAMLTIAPGYPRKGRAELVISGPKKGASIKYRLSRDGMELRLEMRYLDKNPDRDGSRWSTFARVPLDSFRELPLRVFLGQDETHNDDLADNPLSLRI